MDKESIEMVEHDDIKKESSEVDVQGMVDETVRKVREQSDRIQAAATPYAEKTRAFAERQPVLFTFLAIFTALSIVPVCFFVGFVLSATLFFLGVAVVGVLACTLGVVVIGSCIILPVLFVTSLLSMALLSCLLGLFLTHRLYLHVVVAQKRSGDRRVDYESLSKGVKTWLEETVERVPQPPFDYSSLSLGVKQEPREYPAIDPGSPQVNGKK